VHLLSFILVYAIFLVVVVYNSNILLIGYQITRMSFLCYLSLVVDYNVKKR